MQDPEIYLLQLGISVPCAVHPDHKATLDVAHRVFVNWESYFVSDDEALAAFEAEPYRFTGLVTDPVSRMRFQPDGQSPRQDVEGRIFYFETPETAKRFAAMPEMYATPLIGMRDAAN